MPSLPPLTSSASEPSLASRHVDDNRRRRLQHLLTKANSGASQVDVPASQCGSQTDSCRKCGGSKAPSSSSRDKHGPRRDSESRRSRDDGRDAADVGQAQKLRKVESLPNLPLPPVREHQVETGPPPGAQTDAEKRQNKRRNAVTPGQIDQQSAAAQQAAAPTDKQSQRRERRSSRDGRSKNEKRGTFYDNVLSERSYQSPSVDPEQKAGQHGHRKKRYSPRTQRAGEYVRGLMKGTGGPNEWRLHEELDAVDHLLSEDAVKEQENEKLRKYREGLARQSAELNKLRTDQRQADHAYGRSVNEDAERYKAEEEQKRQDRLQFEKRFNEERAAQYADIMNRRKKAQDEDERIEQDLVNRAVKAKRDEEDRDAMRKKKQREQQEKIAEEALEAMKRREEELGLEKENDIRLMLQQKAMLDKQERDRVLYFENLKAKSAAKQAAYEAGAGNELAKKEREDEERARREQQKELERVKKDQEARQEKKKRMEQEGVESVKRQLDMLAEQRHQQKIEDQKYGQLFRQEAARALEEEQEKVRLRRKAEEDNAAFLKKQMAEKSEVIPGKFGHQRMSEVEKSINKAKIDRALDPARQDGLQLLFRQKQLQYHHAGVPAK